MMLSCLALVAALVAGIRRLSELLRTDLSFGDCVNLRRLLDDYSPLSDVHPTDFSRSLFVGQDFNNARVQGELGFCSPHSAKVMQS